MLHNKHSLLKGTCVPQEEGGKVLHNKHSLQKAAAMIGSRATMHESMLHDLLHADKDKNISPSPTFKPCIGSAGFQTLA